MSTKAYNKLIRDRVPEAMTAKGLTYCVHILDGETLSAAMSAKIIEEAVEVAQAHEAIGQADTPQTREALTEELADLYEIIEAFRDSMDISEDRIQEVRAQKNARMGSFKKGIFLESVEEPQQS